MGVTAKLALYAVGLVVVFVAAFGVGSLVGPVLPDQPAGHSESARSPAPDGQDHDDAEEADGTGEPDSTEDHGADDGDQH